MSTIQTVRGRPVLPLFEAIPNVEAHGRASKVEHILVTQANPILILMIYKMF